MKVSSTRSGSVPRRRSLVGLGALVLPVLLAGCGARSGLDCFGERCALSEIDGSPDAGRGDDNTIGNVPPPVLVPPRDDEPTPDVPPSDQPVTGPTAGCGRDGRLRGSLIVTDPAQLQALEGCREVDGSLTITGMTLDDLSELRELRIVGGTLELSGLTGSLAGLENLQTVDNLTLATLTVPSFAPLTSLVQIGSNPLSDAGGSLLIFEINGPPDLSGLGSITSIKQLTISESGSIQSLAGLSVSVAMTAIRIERSPALLDVIGLINLVEVQSLELVELSITNLVGLQNLQSAGSLGIVSTPQLTDLDPVVNLTSLGVLVLEGTGITNLNSLTQLRDVENIVISKNPSLTDLSGLSQLVELTELTVSDNATLVSLPTFASVGAMEQLILRRNPLLGVGPSFPGLVDLDLLEVSENPVLAEVSGFSSLQTARRIQIRDNLTLASLDLSQLSDVRTLNVSCNPALPESSLETLVSVSGSSVISGNQGSASPCAEAP